MPRSEFLRDRPPKPRVIPRCDSHEVTKSKKPILAGKRGLSRALVAAQLVKEPTGFARLRYPHEELSRKSPACASRFFERKRSSARTTAGCFASPHSVDTISSPAVRLGNRSRRTHENRRPQSSASPRSTPCAHSHRSPVGCCALQFLSAA